MPTTSSSRLCSLKTLGRQLGAVLMIWTSFSFSQSTFLEREKKNYDTRMTVSGFLLNSVLLNLSCVWISFFREQKIKVYCEWWFKYEIAKHTNIKRGTWLQCLFCFVLTSIFWRFIRCCCCCSFFTKFIYV